MPEKNKSIGRTISQSLMYIIFGTNILSMIILLLTMLAWVVPPSKMVLFSYLGLGFPFIFILNILYFGFWILFRKWKFAFINLIVFALCWKPVSTYYPLHLETKSIPENSIKIMSYNVRSFNWLQGEKARENPIFDYIKSSDADIICLQEFAAVPQKTNSYDIISVEEINKILKKWPYRSIIKFGQAYGVACYSKYPIRKAERLPLPETTFNGAVAYELEIEGKRVTLINNHLESNRITAEDKKLYQNFIMNNDKREMWDEVTHNITDRLGKAYIKREKQVDYIADYIAQSKNEAIIVCGDFNDTPISYAYQKMKGDMTDSFARSGFGQGITYHENKFWFRIDFIMHSDAFKSYNCEVDKIKYSDHYPVTTYLQMQ